jgi:hypothetical protein
LNLLRKPRLPLELEKQPLAVHDVVCPLVCLNCPRIITGEFQEFVFELRPAGSIHVGVTMFKQSSKS